MKFVQRPLQDLSIRSETPSAPSKDNSSNFSQMLDRHLQNARGQNKSSQPDSQLKNEFDEYFDEVNWDDNVANLKSVDSEYYSKATSKKTLASHFSKEQNASLEKRLDKYKHLIDMNAKKYKLDPVLLAGLLKQESNFNPYAVSHCGAMGMGQIMPKTARYLGVKDPFNASQNIEGAAKYLREQLDTFNGSIDKALAAYNAGPGAVKKHGGIPPYQETQNYVKSIKSHMRQIAMLGKFNIS